MRDKEDIAARLARDITATDLHRGERIAAGLRELVALPPWWVKAAEQHAARYYPQNTVEELEKARQSAESRPGVWQPNPQNTRDWCLAKGNADPPGPPPPRQSQTALDAAIVDEAAAKVITDYRRVQFHAAREHYHNLRTARKNIERQADDWEPNR